MITKTCGLNYNCNDNYFCPGKFSYSYNSNYSVGMSLIAFNYYYKVIEPSSDIPYIEGIFHAQDLALVVRTNDSSIRLHHLGFYYQSRVVCPLTVSGDDASRCSYRHVSWSS